MKLRISEYEKRLRQRFPALVGDPIWTMVEKLVQEDWRDDDEHWFPGVQQTCIDLSKRLGLSFGPARCGDCERDWPEAGDVPDGGKCPACAANDAERAKQQAAHRAWYESLSAEDRQSYDETGRVSLLGVIKRDVQ